MRGARVEIFIRWTPNAYGRGSTDIEKNPGERDCNVSACAEFGGLDDRKNVTGV
jgi:hypothetical protein